MGPRMRERNRPPFQARVASVAIITTVAVLVAASISFMLQQWSVSRQQARLEETTLASVLATATAPDLAVRDLPELQHDVAAAAASHHVVDIRLVDASGAVLAVYVAPKRSVEE